MSELYTRDFWLEALDRAIKTAAQAPLVVWGVADYALDLFSLDWQAGLAHAGGGFLISLLTSIASAGLAQRGNASILSVPGSSPPEEVD